MIKGEKKIWQKREPPRGRGVTLPGAPLWEGAKGVPPKKNKRPRLGLGKKSAQKNWPPRKKKTPQKKKEYRFKRGRGVLREGE